MVIVFRMAGQRLEVGYRPPNLKRSGLRDIGVV